MQSPRGSPRECARRRRKRCAASTSVLMLAVLFSVVTIVDSLPVPATALSSGFGIRQVNIIIGCVPEISTAPSLSWRQNVSFGVEDDEAQFLVLRFARLLLPRGATLVIRDGNPHSKRAPLRFDHSTKTSRFYAHPVYSRRAVVEYMVDLATSQRSDSNDACYGVHIDQYRFAAQSAYRGKRQERQLGEVDADEDEYDFNSEWEATTSSLSSDFVEEEDQGEVDEADAFDEGEMDGSSTSADSDSHDPECVSVADESDRAACVKFNIAVFQKTNAVVRLLIHKEMGSIFCTGWMFGCQGHILTNNHCVSEQVDANSTFIEFLAQGTNCRDDCDKSMGCPGVIEATSSEIVASSRTEILDYTLLLPRLSPMERLNLTRKYGFLTMRSSRAVHEERIFIPQHPAGFGKRIALKHRAEYGRVASLNESGCNRPLESIGYFLDTKGGSSGSPVIAFEDKAVIGMHYCGGCLNSAIPADRIVQSLIDSAKLPKCAQSEFQWPGPSSADEVDAADDVNVADDSVDAMQTAGGAGDEHDRAASHSTGD